MAGEAFGGFVGEARDLRLDGAFGARGVFSLAVAGLVRPVEDAFGDGSGVAAPFVVERVAAPSSDGDDVLAVFELEEDRRVVRGFAVLGVVGARGEVRVWFWVSSV